MEQQNQLLEILQSYGVNIESISATTGNAVTLYEIKPALGIRISKIRNLKDEIAVGMGVQGVRIIAPMMNGMVGIEVPNKERLIIPMNDILKSQEYDNCTDALPCAFGKLTTGDVFIRDLAQMPHLLIAGATGQGKSVGLNMLLMSLMTKRSPEEMRLVLIDPKRVEFGNYAELEDTYLACPVISDVQEAFDKLNDLCRIMEERYSLLSGKNVRNIFEYNAKVKEKLPYIVVVIDEYGDLILSGGRQIEKAICRLAQKARAVGIHMIISTQRPSATIVTGDIKANFPTRVAFRTTTGTDSRVILDQTGAEKLMGKGDMIFYNGAETIRAQCALVTMDDIDSVFLSLLDKYEDYEWEDIFTNANYGNTNGKLTEKIIKAAAVAARLDGVSSSILKDSLGVNYTEASMLLSCLINLNLVTPYSDDFAAMSCQQRDAFLMEYGERVDCDLPLRDQLTTKLPDAAAFAAEQEWVTPGMIADHIGITWQEAARTINQLIRLGIVTSMRDGKFYTILKNRQTAYFRATNCTIA